MKKILLVFGLILLTYNTFAQDRPRLIAKNDPNLNPVPGQSVLLISNNWDGTGAVIYIDGILKAHMDYGTREKIIVPDGSHVVEAIKSDWNSRTASWVQDRSIRAALSVSPRANTIAMDITRGPRGPRLNAVNTSLLVYTDSSAAAPLPEPVRAVSLPQETPETGIEGAIARSRAVFTGELPKDSIIAVLSISSNDTELANFAMDELEYQLVNAKQLTIIDQKILDTLGIEQKKQLSGDVSDSSAAAIGDFLGASIVITGSISGSGNAKRLTLKALDVKTAQIITMTREQF